MSSFLKVKGENISQETGSDYNESGNKYFNSPKFEPASSSSTIKKIAVFTVVCVGIIFIVKRVKK